MDAIRKREGLGSEEFWVMADEGPADYRNLENELADVIERITDTVFVFVLRRYDMGAYADLFETNRDQFEIEREIGSRITSKDAPPGVGELVDNHIAEKYGRATLERILARVDQIRKNLR